jgi:hypothetical protein
MERHGPRGLQAAPALRALRAVAGGMWAVFAAVCAGTLLAAALEPLADRRRRAP